MSNNIFKMFKVSKKAECGYISVLAHRAHDLAELESEGWVRSEADLKKKFFKKGADSVNSKNNRRQQSKTL